MYRFNPLFVGIEDVSIDQELDLTHQDVPVKILLKLRMRANERSKWFSRTFEVTAIMNPLDKEPDVPSFRVEGRGITIDKKEVKPK